ncbi:hypothetical protein BC832DRAFT_367688 [Gaertneriomyces semiglobifer]|nr:hypothetical protein BC832DRAFT_367688 [Gaertneriomyces semiglobifer]
MRALVFVLLTAAHAIGLLSLHRHVADWSCRNVVAIATHFNSSPEHSHRLRGPSVCLFRLVGEKLVWLERCEAPASRESGATQLEFLKWDQHGKHLAGVDSYGHIIIWGSQTPSDQWIFQHVFDVGESVAAVAWIHEDREWTLSRDASSDLGPALIRAQHKGPRLPTSGIGLVVLTVSGRVSRLRFTR